MSEALTKEAQAGRKPKGGTKERVAAKERKPLKGEKRTIDTSLAPMDQFDNPAHAFSHVLDLVAAAAHDEGQVGYARNDHRWRKGLAINEAVILAGDLPKGSFTGSAVKFAVNEVVETLKANGDEGAADRLAPAEVSIVRGAAQAWLGTAGLDTTLKNGLRVADIAINKAHAVSNLPDRFEIRDLILPFVHEHPETVARQIARISKTQKFRSAKQVEELVNTVTAQAKKAKVPVTKVLAGIIRELKGEKLFENIGVDKEFFDGDWAALRSHATDLETFLGFPVDDKTGLISNTKLLERMMQYFAPREQGYEGLIQAYIDAGELTPEQAESFRAVMAENADADDYVEPEFADGTQPEVEPEPIGVDLGDPAGSYSVETEGVPEGFDAGDDGLDETAKEPLFVDDETATLDMGGLVGVEVNPEKLGEVLEVYGEKFMSEAEGEGVPADVNEVDSWTDLEGESDFDDDDDDDDLDSAF